MNKFLVTCLFLASCSITTFAQFDSTYVPEILKDTNYVSKGDYEYDEQIRTVRLRALRSEKPEPVISIYPSSKIELSFDDLRDDYRELYYVLVYCDKDWETLPLLEAEFYRRNSLNTLDEYEFSTATKIDYTHYRLVLPENDDRFLRSGNYRLHILDAETDSLVLTRRFMVVDPKLTIKAAVVRSGNTRYSDYKQQIRFEVYDPSSSIEELGNIFVRISKNNSWDIVCHEVKPSFVSNDRITFDRIDACTFDGGNEYRFFNMIDFKNISNNFVRVNFLNRGLYGLWLDIDKPRSYLQYSTAEDLNGRNLYTSELKAFNPNELDYAEVNFTFKPDDVMLDREIYVYGELSNYQLDPNYKMTYNADRDVYELNALLKQGFYNYQYVVKSIYQEGPDESMLEGSHFETENNYTLYVYYHNAFESIDQLLGIQRINSRRLIDD